MGVAAVLLLTGCGSAPAPLMAGLQIDGDAINAPINGDVGSVSRGQTVFTSRGDGHCVLCHAIEGLDAEFQGDVGPDLTAVATRLSSGQIRLRIVDASQVHTNTVMPPYYRTEDLHRVEPDYQGAPMLSSQDIEDLVAYLSQQTG